MRVAKIGHVEFEVGDLAAMTEHYRDVVGLTLTDHDAETSYLTSTLDHHCVVLRRQRGPAKLAKIAFEVAAESDAEIVAQLATHGVAAEIRSDSQPGIGGVVRTTNPDGLAIELYREAEPVALPYAARGVVPHKLSHVATLCLDVGKTTAFYTDVLGFRFSDAIGDVFTFLRCGCDHHTVNLLAGERAGLQHVAFEVNDMDHIRRACEVLGHGGIDTLWGPLRHGAGHNLAVYHHDPEEQIVEFCAELDRMSNEELGYFDPRPWHADRPQRPKVWQPRPGAIVWGQFPPPDAFGKGIAAPGGG